MTFNEFKKNYERLLLLEKESIIRSYVTNGQVLYNYFTRVWPDEADRLINDKKLDCFFNNNNVNNLLEYLEDNWHKNPN